MKFVPNALSRTVARQGLLAAKNSPSILFGVGVVGMIGSTVLACRATLKLNDVTFDTKHDLHVAKSLDHEDYSEQDRKKDIAIIYTRGVVKVAKLYGPSVILGSVAIGCLTKSHNILSERNAALTAAYAAVDKAFNNYRERVVEKYGRDQDQEFRYSTEKVDIVDEETGQVVSRIRVSEDAPSMYARFFDQLCSNWSKETDYNRVFLTCQERYANDLLKTRGHVFLNEVYDLLGFERTKAGAVVGWIISDDGDNFIDFGLYNSNRESIRDFINGREGAILLDFNVDGVIYDKIDNKGERLSWQQ